MTLDQPGLDPAGSHVFISPHLDDAVLSCGARIRQLAAAGEPVTVLTVFAGPPGPGLSRGARSFHRLCGLGEDAVAVRRREDEAACRVLGAQPRHLDLPDALYRHTPQGKPRYGFNRSLRTADPANEAPLVARIGQDLARTQAVAAATAVYAPLALGNHIDHLLVRLAVTELWREPGRSGSVPLYYYEDLPYACRMRPYRLHELLGPSWSPWLQWSSRSAWAAKREAALGYASQIKVLELAGGSVDMLLTYACSLGAGRPAERLWTCKSAAVLPPIV